MTSVGTVSRDTADLERVHSTQTLQSGASQHVVKRVSVIARATAQVPGPPLDYSFKELSSLREVPAATPNSGLRKKRPEEEQANRVQRVGKDGRVITKKKNKRELVTQAIRLNNNTISTWDGFAECCTEVMSEPDGLNWIDMSFNHLTTIDHVLLHYPNLAAIYLHANNISSLAEIDKLAQLPHLRSLTLHGNPVEGVKNYRQYVIATLPSLRSIDFSSITKQDRENAAAWQSFGSQR